MMMNMAKLDDDTFMVTLSDASMNVSWMMNRESIHGLSDFLRMKSDELWSDIDVASMSGHSVPSPLESHEGNYREGG